MINDLRLRMETSYRPSECIDSTFYVSRRLCAFEKRTRANTLTRALKIYHLARGAFYIVPRYACRIVSLSKRAARPSSLNAQRSKGSDRITTRLSLYIRVTWRQSVNWVKNYRRRRLTMDESVCVIGAQYDFCNPNWRVVAFRLYLS